MKPCPEYKETLMLDVYGELEQSESAPWEAHLKTCEACREERRRLQHLLKQITLNMPSPALSPEQSNMFTSSVMREVNGVWHEPQETRRFFFPMPNRLVPALATATVLIAVFSWFTMKEFSHHPAFQKFSSISSVEQVSSEDLEVIKNLEFLEEMDELEKLVQFLETPDYEKIPQPGNNNIQDA